MLCGDNEVSTVAVSKRRTLDRGSVNHKQSTSNQKCGNGMHRADAAAAAASESQQKKSFRKIKVWPPGAH